jgi:hypothetical protein
MSSQVLTLTLDGITPADYLTWVRDPEPRVLGLDLCSVTVGEGVLGDSVEIALSWRGLPPHPRVAAPVAGFPLTPEVVSVAERALAIAA